MSRVLTVLTFLFILIYSPAYAPDEVDNLGRDLRSQTVSLQAHAVRRLFGIANNNFAAPSARERARNILLENSLAAAPYVEEYLYITFYEDQGWTTLAQQILLRNLSVGGAAAQAYAVLELVKFAATGPPNTEPGQRTRARIEQELRNARVPHIVASILEDRRHPRVQMEACRILSTDPRHLDQVRSTLISIFGNSQSDLLTLAESSELIQEVPQDLVNAMVRGLENHVLANDRDESNAIQSLNRWMRRLKESIGDNQEFRLRSQTALGRLRDRAREFGRPELTAHIVFEIANMSNWDPHFVKPLADVINEMPYNRNQLLQRVAENANPDFISTLFFGLNHAIDRTFLSTLTGICSLFDSALFRRSQI